MSLASSPTTTMLAITEPERAQVFYGDVLGLPFKGKNLEGSLIFELAGGATLGLLTRPAGSQPQHTALSFEVDDVPAAITDLEDRGVVFEDYDLPGLKTVDHVCVLGSERAAWFLDPDGNVLCLHQNL
ncbi:MAG: hypothetical protein QOI06_293 [Nocardioidaceae bacterium]|jgi:predicted enzyme related to lactoylglutathione lyase|nr:hypothetical protein [Nocardioidaceae bacterium]